MFALIESGTDSGLHSARLPGLPRIAIVQELPDCFMLLDHSSTALAASVLCRAAFDDGSSSSHSAASSKDDQSGPRAVSCAETIHAIFQTVSRQWLHTTPFASLEPQREIWRLPNSSGSCRLAQQAANHRQCPLVLVTRMLTKTL